MDGSSTPTEVVDRESLRTESPMGIARSLLSNMRAWQERNGTSGLKDREFVELSAKTLGWKQGDVYRALRLALAEQDALRPVSLEQAGAMFEMTAEVVRKTMHVF